MRESDCLACVRSTCVLLRIYSSYSKTRNISLSHADVTSKSFYAQRLLCSSCGNGCITILITSDTRTHHIYVQNKTNYEYYFN